MLNFVPLRRDIGDTGGDAAVLERRTPVAPADDDPLALALQLVGGPWRPLVAWQLFWGPRCFGELVRRTPGINPRALRHALAELERDGLVRTRRRPRVKRQAEYALSPFGESLKPLLATLFLWGLGVLRSRRLPCGRPQPEIPSDMPWLRPPTTDKENVS